MEGWPRGMSTQPRLSVGALVIRDGKVLLLRRGPGAPFEIGAWTMPAGGIEIGDLSIVLAAARELYEETGARLLGGHVLTHVDGLACPRPYVALIVRGTLTPDDQPYNREPRVHDEIGWFAADDVPANTWDRALIVRTLREERR